MELAAANTTQLYTASHRFKTMPGFKDELLQLSKSLGISPQDFNAVGIHAWPSIMQKIESVFVIKTNSNTRFNWWWESFKGSSFSMFFENDLASTVLHQLIDGKETVWFVVCDTDHDPSKFWLFQATIRAIQTVLNEHCFFEYYIVSKKYSWLLCETDHSKLVGIGSIVTKMKALHPNVGLAS